VPGAAVRYRRRILRIGVCAGKEAVGVTVFITALKRILRHPINWAFVLLFPVIFAVLIALTTAGDSDPRITDASFFFGVVDQDKSALSETLISVMSERFLVTPLNSRQDINAALTDSEVPWVLLIREGYGKCILRGQAVMDDGTSPLEGYSLALTPVASLGRVTAENITRSLMLLGTDDEAKLNAWLAASTVAVEIADKGDNWETIAFWFGFFGFVSMFTAYFVVKTLAEDKRRGMPDRIGLLPLTARRVNAQSVLAAFAATQITVAVLLVVLRVQLGTIPNAVPLFVLLSLYNAFVVALVVTAVTFSKDMGAASVVVTMTATVLSMLGGLFWPLDFVPPVMRVLARVSPGYWLSQGLANIKMITWSGYWLPVLCLAAFVAVTVIISGLRRVQKNDE
jgi:ABC-2 type transport system permease protein